MFKETNLSLLKTFYTLLVKKRWDVIQSKYTPVFLNEFIAINKNAPVPT